MSFTIQARHIFYFEANGHRFSVKLGRSPDGLEAIQVEDMALVEWYIPRRQVHTTHPRYTRQMAIQDLRRWMLHVVRETVVLLVETVSNKTTLVLPLGVAGWF
ncbi:hypothetical protein C8J57DRAFT_1212438 [Mycena rebaudengoi]|nr:hypothetical protein C8J57DRAFT_1212438 [Mycena rebaudengoi]